jgi:hypothetical protein
MALFLAAMMTGCQTGPTDAPQTHGDHLGLYVSQKLGMVPVRPLTEDIRIGDVFLYPENPEGEKGDAFVTFTPITQQRWTSLVVSDDLVEEYRERPELPSTPEAFAQGDGWPEMETTGALGSREGESRHLRIMHIPGFSISRERLNDVLPSHVATMMMGRQKDNWTGIGIRVPSAGAYSLDVDDVLDLLVDSSRDGTYRLKQEHLDHLLTFPDPNLDTIYVRVVSEVLFARSIQATMFYDPSLLDDLDDGVEASELGLQDLEDGDDDDSDDDLDEEFAPIARARALNEQMKKTGTDILPDGFVRFMAVSDEAVTVRKVWRRPLAIGVRGVTLEVDKYTGDVLRMGWMGSPLRKR